MFSRSVERFGVKNMHQNERMFSRSVERFGVKNMHQNERMFSRSVERFGVKNMHQFTAWDALAFPLRADAH